MGASPTPEELRQLERQLVVRAAVYGLRHLGKLDIRTLTMLQAGGMLRDAVIPTDYRRLLPILQDSKHSARVDPGPGPLVVVEEGDATRLVVKMSNLLLGPEVEMRVAASEFLESLRANRGGLLATTKECCIRNAEGIRGSDSWTDSALKTYDSLENDYLLALQGLGQCLSLGFAPGVEEYLDRVIRPSPAMVGALWNSIVAEEGDRRNSSEGAHEKAPLVARLDDFLNQHGHRVWFRRGLRDVVVGSGVLQRSKKACWRTLWDWAEGSRTPLAEYHVCLFYANSPELVPRGAGPSVWKRIVEGITKANRTEGDKGWYEEAWALRCRIAGHYCQYLEMIFAGSEGPRITTLAWWMAERFGQLLEASSEKGAQVDAAVLEQAFARSRFEFSFLRPPTGGSPVRAATLGLAEPWSVALVASLGEQIRTWKPDRISASTEEQFTEALVGMLLRASLLLGDSTEWGDGEGLGDRLVPTVRAWAEELKTQGTREGLRKLVDFAEVICGEKELPENLRRMPEAEEHVQAATAQAVRVLAYSGRNISASLWPHVQNETWFLGACSMASDWGIEALADALLEIQAREGVEWRVLLPHAFANAVEKCETSDNRREALVSFVVMSSTLSQSVTAIKRLGQRAKDPVVARALLGWRERLLHLQRGTVPWLASRIRPIISALENG